MSRSTPDDSVPFEATPPRRRWRLWCGNAARAHRVFFQADRLWHRAPGAADTVPYERWEDWCAAHPGTQVQGVLGSGLTQNLLAPPELPLTSAADVGAWARQQWVHYVGAAAQAWPVAAWAGGATALTGVALDALTRTAQAHRVRLLQLRPWWSCAWPAVQRLVPQALPDGNGVVWLVEAPMVTRLALRQGQPVTLEQRWLDEPLPPALEELIDEYRDADGPQCIIGCGMAAPPRSRAPGAAPSKANVLGRLQGPVPQVRWWGR